MVDGALVAEPGVGGGVPLPARPGRAPRRPAAAGGSPRRLREPRVQPQPGQLGIVSLAAAQSVFRSVINNTRVTSTLSYLIS